jgi:hypothetical protein
MAIDRAVCQAVEHLTGHYFEDHPLAGDVTATDLAAYVEALGVCEPCRAGFLAAVGAADLAEAFARVWDSPAWRAYQAADQAADDEEVDW